MIKLLIKNPTQRTEALVQMNVPYHEQNEYPKLYPSVWIVRMPETKGEIGELMEVVGLDDFETPDNISKARAILEWLNDPKFDDGFPIETIATVEKYTRRLSLYCAEFSTLAGLLDKEKRAAQHLQERMKQQFYLEYRDLDFNATDARAKASIKLEPYDNKIEEAANNEKNLRLLISAINKMQVTMASQLSRLNFEYKQIHHSDVGA